MKPTANGRHAPPRPHPRLRPTGDPYRIGWREVPRASPDGTVEYDRVPLTVEDALHPQFGDVMPQGELHEDDRTYLLGVFRWRLRGDPSARVYSDLLINWGLPGMGDHSPDINATRGLRDPERPRTSFDVAAEGVRPFFLAEVVSPAYRDNDVVTKPLHYHRCRVPLYLIVDRRHPDDAPTLIGYRYTKARYVRLRPDRRGRLWLKPLGLWVGVEGKRVVCYDGETGQEIKDYPELAQDLEAAAKEAAAARRKVAREKRRADDEKQRADDEKQRADDEKQRADDEKQRADDAVARNRQLEEELRRLRGGSP